MTKRITNEIRDKIADDLMRHRFDADKKAIAIDLARLAAALYEDAYSKAERDLMAKLPYGWMPEAGALRVNIGGYQHYVYYNGKALGRALSDRELAEIGLCASRRTPYARNSGTIPKTYDGSHKFAAEMGRIEAETARLHEEIREASSKARAVLNKAKTFKRLLETWPEIEPFAKPYMGSTAAAVPAVPIADLNKAFGLPADS